MPFSVKFGSVTRIINPSRGASPQDIKELVAVAFGLQLGTFGIHRDSEYVTFDASLDGEWELALIPTGRVDRSRQCSPRQCMCKCFLCIYLFEVWQSLKVRGFDCCARSRPGFEGMHFLR